MYAWTEPVVSGDSAPQPRQMTSLTCSNRPTVPRRVVRPLVGFKDTCEQFIQPLCTANPGGPESGVIVIGY
jgi:hypothetical protein